MRYLNYSKIAALFLGFLSLSLGCSQAYDVTFEKSPNSPSSPSATPDSPSSPSSPDSNKGMGTNKPPQVVCNPLDKADAQSPSSRNGLLASLHTFNSDPSIERPEAKSAKYYIQNGHRPHVNLYFSNLFIPPRDFTEGFQTSDGSLLKDESGRVLEEFFGLHFESILQTKKSGKYQFALLSDDGAILSLETPQGVITLNNDGDHTTRMSCSPRFIVKMNSTSRIPLKLDYYQGPRAGISLVLLWRRFNGERPAHEPLCGKNLGFYSFSEPQNGDSRTYWEQLQSRGWKKLDPSNFLLPNDSTNPCESL